VYLEVILAVVPLNKFIDVSHKIPRLAIVVIPQISHTTIAAFLLLVVSPGRASP